MADYTHTNLQVVGIHEPETHRTVNTDGTVTEEELPGIYRVGVIIDDVFHELIAFKGGALTSSRAKAAREAAKSSKTSGSKT